MRVRTRWLEWDFRLGWIRNISFPTLRATSDYHISLKSLLSPFSISEVSIYEFSVSVSWSGLVLNIKRPLIKLQCDEHGTALNRSSSLFRALASNRRTKQIRQISATWGASRDLCLNKWISREDLRIDSPAHLNISSLTVSTDVVLTDDTNRKRYSTRIVFNSLELSLAHMEPCVTIKDLQTISLLSSDASSCDSSITTNQVQFTIKPATIRSAIDILNDISRWQLSLEMALRDSRSSSGDPGRSRWVRIARLINDVAKDSRQRWWKYRNFESSGDWFDRYFDQWLGDNRRTVKEILDKDSISEVWTASRILDLFLEKFERDMTKDRWFEMFVEYPYPFAPVIEGKIIELVRNNPAAVSKNEDEFYDPDSFFEFEDCIDYYESATLTPSEFRFNCSIPEFRLNINDPSQRPVVTVSLLIRNIELAADGTLELPYAALVMQGFNKPAFCCMELPKIRATYTNQTVRLVIASAIDGFACVPQLVKSITASDFLRLPELRLHPLHRLVHTENKNAQRIVDNYGLDLQIKTLCLALGDDKALVVSMDNEGYLRAGRHNTILVHLNHFRLEHTKSGRSPRTHLTGDLKCTSPVPKERRVPLKQVFRERPEAFDLAEEVNKDPVHVRIEENDCSSFRERKDTDQLSTTLDRRSSISFYADSLLRSRTFDSRNIFNQPIVSVGFQIVVSKDNVVDISFPNDDVYICIEYGLLTSVIDWIEHQPHQKDKRVIKRAPVGFKNPPFWRQLKHVLQAFGYWTGETQESLSAQPEAPIADVSTTWQLNLSLNRCCIQLEHICHQRVDSDENLYFSEQSRRSVQLMIERLCCKFKHSVYRAQYLGQVNLGDLCLRSWTNKGWLVVFNTLRATPAWWAEPARDFDPCSNAFSIGMRRRALEARKGKKVVKSELVDYYKAMSECPNFVELTINCYDPMIPDPVLQKFGLLDLYADQNVSLSIHRGVSITVEKTSITSLLVFHNILLLRPFKKIIESTCEQFMRSNFKSDRLQSSKTLPRLCSPIGSPERFGKPMDGEGSSPPCLPLLFSDADVEVPDFPPELLNPDVYYDSIDFDDKYISHILASSSCTCPLVRRDHAIVRCRRNLFVEVTASVPIKAALLSETAKPAFMCFFENYSAKLSQDMTGLDLWMRLLNLECFDVRSISPGNLDAIHSPRWLREIMSTEIPKSTTRTDRARFPRSRSDGVFTAVSSGAESEECIPHALVTCAPDKSGVIVIDLSLLRYPRLKRPKMSEHVVEREALGIDNNLNVIRQVRVISSLDPPQAILPTNADFASVLEPEDILQQAGSVYEDGFEHHGIPTFTEEASEMSRTSADLNSADHQENQPCESKPEIEPIGLNVKCQVNGLQVHFLLMDILDLWMSFSNQVIDALLVEGIPKLELPIYAVNTCARIMLNSFPDVLLPSIIVSPQFIPHDYLLAFWNSLLLLSDSNVSTDGFSEAADKYTADVIMFVHKYYNHFTHRSDEPSDGFILDLQSLLLRPQLMQRMKVDVVLDNLSIDLPISRRLVVYTKDDDLDDLISPTYTFLEDPLRIRCEKITLTNAALQNQYVRKSLISRSRENVSLDSSTRDQTLRYLPPPIVRMLRKLFELSPEYVEFQNRILLSENWEVDFVPGTLLLLGDMFTFELSRLDLWITNQDKWLGIDLTAGLVHPFVGVPRDVPIPTCVYLSIQPSRLEEQMGRGLENTAMRIEPVGFQRLLRFLNENILSTKPEVNTSPPVPRSLRKSSAVADRAKLILSVCLSQLSVFIGQGFNDVHVNDQWEGNHLISLNEIQLDVQLFEDSRGLSSEVIIDGLSICPGNSQKDYLLSLDFGQIDFCNGLYLAGFVLPQTSSIKPVSFASKASSLGSVPIKPGAHIQSCVLVTDNLNVNGSILSIMSLLECAYAFLLVVIVALDECPHEEHHHHNVGSPLAIPNQAKEEEEEVEARYIVFAENSTISLFDAMWMSCGSLGLECTPQEWKLGTENIRLGAVGESDGITLPDIALDTEDADGGGLQLNQNAPLVLKLAIADRFHWVIDGGLVFGVLSILERTSEIHSRFELLKKTIGEHKKQVDTMCRQSSRSTKSAPHSEDSSSWSDNDTLDVQNTTDSYYMSRRLGPNLSPLSRTNSCSSGGGPKSLKSFKRAASTFVPAHIGGQESGYKKTRSLNEDKDKQHGDSNPRDLPSVLEAEISPDIKQTPQPIDAKIPGVFSLIRRIQFTSISSISIAITQAALRKIAIERREYEHEELGFLITLTGINTTVDLILPPSLVGEGPSFILARRSRMYHQGSTTNQNDGEDTNLAHRITSLLQRKLTPKYSPDHVGALDITAMHVHVMHSFLLIWEPILSLANIKIRGEVARKKRNAFDLDVNLEAMSVTITRSCVLRLQRALYQPHLFHGHLPVANAPCVVVSATQANKLNLRIARILNATCCVIGAAMKCISLEMMVKDPDENLIPAEPEDMDLEMILAGHCACCDVSLGRNEYATKSTPRLCLYDRSDRTIQVVLEKDGLVENLTLDRLCLQIPLFGGTCRSVVYEEYDGSTTVAIVDKSVCFINTDGTRLFVSKEAASTILRQQINLNTVPYTYLPADDFRAKGLTTSRANIMDDHVSGDSFTRAPRSSVFSVSRKSLGQRLYKRRSFGNEMNSQPTNECRHLSDLVQNFLIIPHPLTNYRKLYQLDFPIRIWNKLPFPTHEKWSSAPHEVTIEDGECQPLYLMCGCVTQLEIGVCMARAKGWTKITKVEATSFRRDMRCLLNDGKRGSIEITCRRDATGCIHIILWPKVLVWDVTGRSECRNSLTMEVLPVKEITAYAPLSTSVWVQNSNDGKDNSEYGEESCDFPLIGSRYAGIDSSRGPDSARSAGDYMGRVYYLPSITSDITLLYKNHPLTDSTTWPFSIVKNNQQIKTIGKAGALPLAAEEPSLEATIIEMRRDIDVFNFTKLALHILADDQNALSKITLPPCENNPTHVQLMLGDLTSMICFTPEQETENTDLVEIPFVNHMNGEVAMITRTGEWIGFYITMHQAKISILPLSASPCHVFILYHNLEESSAQWTNDVSTHHRHKHLRSKSVLEPMRAPQELTITCIGPTGEQHEAKAVQLCSKRCIPLLPRRLGDSITIGNLILKRDADDWKKSGDLDVSGSGIAEAATDRDGSLCLGKSICLSSLVEGKLCETMLFGNETAAGEELLMKVASKDREAILRKLCEPMEETMGAGASPSSLQLPVSPSGPFVSLVVKADRISCGLLANPIKSPESFTIDLVGLRIFAYITPQNEISADVELNTLHIHANDILLNPPLEPTILVNKDQCFKACLRIKKERFLHLLQICCVSLPDIQTYVDWTVVDVVLYTWASLAPILHMLGNSAPETDDCPPLQPTLYSWTQRSVTFIRMPKLLLSFSPYMASPPRSHILSGNSSGLSRIASVIPYVVKSTAVTGAIRDSEFSLLSAEKAKRPLSSLPLPEFVRSLVRVNVPFHSLGSLLTHLDALGQPSAVFAEIKEVLSSGHKLLVVTQALKQSAVSVGMHATQAAAALLNDSITQQEALCGRTVPPKLDITVRRQTAGSLTCCPSSEVLEEKGGFAKTLLNLTTQLGKANSPPGNICYPVICYRVLLGPYLVYYGASQQEDYPCIRLLRYNDIAAIGAVGDIAWTVRELIIGVFDPAPMALPWSKVCGISKCADTMTIVISYKTGDTTMEHTIYVDLEFDKYLQIFARLRAQWRARRWWYKRLV